MKIAAISYHTCPLSDEGDPEFGGLNTYVLELSKALAKMGIGIDIFTRCVDPTSEKIIQVLENLRVIHLKAGKEAKLAKNGLTQYIPEFLTNFYDFANEIKYDFVSSHYYLSGLVGLEIKNKLKIPLVVTFHTLALLKNLASRNENEEENVKRTQAELMLIQKTDKIIATSEADLEYIHTLYNCPREKISILIPGVDLNIFRPADKGLAKKKIGVDPNHKLILFVGRIDPLKGIDVLLYAIKIIIQKYPNLNVCLWIVGAKNIEDRKKWSRELKRLKEIKRVLEITPQVMFVGKKSKEELPFYYNSAEVVIMPSQYESFGIAALEAMACGVPVITTDVAGISGLLDKEHSSLLTSANNPIMLSKKIKHLLTNDAEREKVSQLLLRQVQNLSWQAQAEKFIQILTK